MDQLFKYLRTQLMATPGNAWTDADKGQTASYESHPPIAFPASLIKVDFPKIEKYNSKLKKYTARIIIKLVWDYSGTTDSTASDELLAESLDYFTLVNAVKAKLDGAIDLTVFNKPLELTSMLEENRRDQLKVMNLTFNTVVFAV
ncbi:hypothetical protein [Pedobacter arcticus]|uniref:hypothetical protein n=1 Tax=Pedobacter arcticus TaxID=752140 RepID=UPI00058CF86C|nr:hypothetical protein [Pedobacter arcticus]